MAKLSLPDIGSLANSASARQAINDNFTAIEEAIENTLSRDGTTPNSMAADLDMDSNSIVNVADPVNDLDAVNKRSVDTLVDEAVALIVSDADHFPYQAEGGVLRSLGEKLAETLSLNDYNFNEANSAVENDAGWAACYAEAVARGGAIIEIEPGTYSVSAEWTISQSGITVRGKSRQSVLLDFSEQTSGDGINFFGADFFRLEGVNVRNAFRHGIAVTENSLDNPSRGEICHCVALANGSHGFYNDDGFLIRYNNCRAQANTNYGFYFDGYHTTINAIACQAQSNGGGGWRLNDMTYSTFESCGADQNTGNGWVIQNANAVTLIGCGAEFNTGAGVLVQASSTIATGAIAADIKGVTLRNFFAYNNDASGTSANFLRVIGHTGNTNRIDIEVEGCVDMVATGPSVLVSGNVRYLPRRNSFVGAESITTFAVRQSYPQNEQNPFGKSITAASTPVFNLADQIGGTTQYAGMLVIAARSAKFADGLGGTAQYVLAVIKAASGSGVTVISSGGQTAGAGATHPSFTWALNTTTNQLEATPVASTTGTFYFNIVPVGDIRPSFV